MNQQLMEFQQGLVHIAHFPKKKKKKHLQSLCEVGYLTSSPFHDPNFAGATDLMRDGTMMADSPCEQLQQMLNVHLCCGSFDVEG